MLKCTTHQLKGCMVQTHGGGGGEFNSEDMPEGRGVVNGTSSTQIKFMYSH